MGKTIFEKYQEMMESSGFDPDTGEYTGAKYHRRTFEEDDEDAETFVTSKEIAKMQEEENPSSSGIARRPDEFEEYLHFKRYTEVREHKYTEAELEQIRESCRYCLVHDYSEQDIYHISDEERAKLDSLNEIATKLSGLKTTYGQVDKYVLAMRIVVEAWELLEKKENYLHSDEEFWKMISDGRIYHNRIPIPKLRHMDRYNKDLLIQYISNPDLDPSDLLSQEKQEENAWYMDDGWDEPEEDDEEAMKRLLSPEEVQYILDHEEHPEDIYVKEFKRSELKGYEGNKYHRFRSKKKRKLSKRKKYVRDNLHDILMKIQSNPKNHDSDIQLNRSTLLTHSMFEPPKRIKNPFDDIHFDASWTDKNALFIYDLIMREKMLETAAPGGVLTYGDLEFQDVFKMMEEQGMNVTHLRQQMNMTSEADKRATIKKKQKENRKIESSLLQRITKLNRNPKFKKLIGKAEDKLNKMGEEE